MHNVNLCNTMAAGNTTCSIKKPKTETEKIEFIACV